MADPVKLTIDGQEIEGQPAGAPGVGQLPPGGDHDQEIAARHRQERADLIIVGSVVEDNDGPAAAQMGPPQRDPHRRVVRLRHLLISHARQPTPGPFVPPVRIVRT